MPTRFQIPYSKAAAKLIPPTNTSLLFGIFFMQKMAFSRMVFGLPEYFDETMFLHGYFYCYFPEKERNLQIKLLESLLQNFYHAKQDKRST
jgi:hypothetical protein